MIATPRTDALLVALCQPEADSRLVRHARQLEQELAIAKEDARCAWATARSSDTARIEEMKKRDALQAKVDELMLEYCPDEMTEEQLRNWESHQRAFNEV